MERLALLLMVMSLVLLSCSPTSTPTPQPAPTATALPTAARIVATPPPGPTLVLRAYMQLVHERVLVEFVQRAQANADLLASATRSGFDADALCPGPAAGSWQHFGDLSDQLSVIVPPPQAQPFHDALAEALSRAEQTAESYDWFCETYATFGQPAEGMWGRLSQQVQACQARTAALREEWQALGGGEMGLIW